MNTALLTVECVACKRMTAIAPNLQCEECNPEPGGGALKRAPLEVIAGGVRKNPQEIKQAPFPGHVVIVLPWSALASDNLRKGVVGASSREKQGRYDDALARARVLAREAYQGEPFAGPARISCVFYMPDNARRDVANFSKALFDALKSVVIIDDYWQVLQDVRLRVAGIDADRPRCEITLEALIDG